MKCDQVTGSCQNLSWSEYQLKDYGDHDNDGVGGDEDLTTITISTQVGH